MSFLNQISGALGGTAAPRAPVPDKLTALLGGRGEFGRGTQTGDRTGMDGGIVALVARLESAGLGNLVQSWIGDGPNQAISPQQLQNALGMDQVQMMAARSGITPQDLLSQLSQHLPRLVNRLPPTVPDR